MLKSLRNFATAILEGIQDAKNYKNNPNGYVEKYLSQSVDQHDLERRQKELAARGVL